MNAHSLLWDDIQPSDTKGTAIEDWMIDKDLTLVNDGTHTRTRRVTGNESTPDITLCGRSWKDKISWSVEKPIGGSDHLPILIEVNNKVKHVNNLDSKVKWKSRDVDWEVFKETVEQEILNIDETKVLSTKEEFRQYNKIQTSTAEIHVGETKASRNTKDWMTPHVRAAIRK